MHGQHLTESVKQYNKFDRVEKILYRNGRNQLIEVHFRLTVTICFQKDNSMQLNTFILLNKIQSASDI